RRQLEILRGVTPLRGDVVERVAEADPLDRLLRDAVEIRWRSNSDRLVEGGYDVDHVHELGAQTALVLDSCGPGDDHRVAGAAEVAGDLFRPLERRVHRVRPSGREVIEVLGAAELVDRLEVILPLLRDAVEEQVLVDRPLEAPFGARS